MTVVLKIFFKCKTKQEESNLEKYICIWCKVLKQNFEGGCFLLNKQHYFKKLSRLLSLEYPAGSSLGLRVF